jgi:hypothetical protein
MVTGELEMKVRCSQQVQKLKMSLIMKARREGFVGSDGCNFYIHIYGKKGKKGQMQDE